jgi:nitric oxide reductase activation protein
MGVAMRHSGNILQNQKNDKKILLILTDGEPSDIDVKDQNLLIEDAKQARIELQQKNIFTYCINLDQKSDEYVRRIFLKNYAIIDDILTLPEKLAQIFLKLTR